MSLDVPLIIKRDASNAVVCIHQFTSDGKKQLEDFADEIQEIATEVFENAQQHGIQIDAINIWGKEREILERMNLTHKARQWRRAKCGEDTQPRLLFLLHHLNEMYKNYAASNRDLRNSRMKELRRKVAPCRVQIATPKTPEYLLKNYGTLKRNFREMEEKEVVDPATQERRKEAVKDVVQQFRMTDALTKLNTL